ncbi:MAG: thiosulfate oxidation carrier complex protein SoxZ [Hyphomicrobium sp.]|nr:MAG: thiosulfate oxidation carrier complex protein SoxZ [Hyphomicrobium sp.]
MTTQPTPRVRMPATAKAGEVVEVKTLISHEMESGQRKDKDGKLIPRKIIKQFTATFNGKEIMKADWHGAISANPYQSFFVRVPESGTFVFSWTDDDGSVYKAEQKVTVG